MSSEPAGLLSQYIRIAAVVAAYWIVSILTVFVNKALLSSDEVKLDAPLFITWFQCVLSAVICTILSMLSKLFPNRIPFPQGHPYSMDVVKKVLPLSVLFTFMLASNNLCLKYVDVAFYYMGRSLTTIFHVILSYSILGQKTSYGCLACCAIIIGGYWLGIDQENVAGSLSVRGTIFGVLGSLSLSLYSIYTKRVLPSVNQEIWLLSYYNNVYSVFLFLPLMIVNGEISVVYNYDKLGELMFWGVMIVGGVCGFAVGFVTVLQIKVTSPLTNNISGTAKACTQTLIATYWLNEHKPILWWIGNCVVLGGSAGYARLKQMDMESARHKNQTSTEPKV